MLSSTLTTSNIPKKRVAIMGSTGSIGTQTLEVIKQFPNLFLAEVLVAQNNSELLIKQALEFNPNAVVIENKNKYPEVKQALSHTDIKVFAGAESVTQIVEMESVDIVLSAIVGFSGLASTINAIKHGKPIALANKETLVVAGQLISELLQQHKVPILPVDSEHSAIFQCLVGEYLNPIEKIILTASGGPFRGKDLAFLQNVTKEQALNHPVWKMGSKISIDSATLMNKGLEVIEAAWLFNLKPHQIEVIVHPQSIIHSIVQFEDNSMKAQMGLPDMKLPIVYALSYPNRVQSNFVRFDFLNYPELTFQKPNLTLFKNLKLAYQALQTGGNAPCVLNAANEVVVEAFLNNKISFLGIADTIEQTLNTIPFFNPTTLEEYQQCDKETRAITYSLIK